MSSVSGRPALEWPGCARCLGKGASVGRALGPPQPEPGALPRRALREGARLLTGHLVCLQSVCSGGVVGGEPGWAAAARPRWASWLSHPGGGVCRGPMLVGCPVLMRASLVYQSTKLWIIMEYLGGGSALDLVRCGPRSGWPAGRGARLKLSGGCPWALGSCDLPPFAVLAHRMFLGTQLVLRGPGPLQASGG